MAVIFQATIKMNSKLEWQIELKDTVDGRVQECKDVEEFSKKVEEFGDDYGGHIDEVKWLKDENVPEQVMDELRVKMAEHRAEIEEKTGETVTPLAEEEK